MKNYRGKPGWDSKVIAHIAQTRFGSLEAMFKSHGWPERGSKMMLKVQSHVAETYGSVDNFRNHYKRVKI